MHACVHPALSLALSVIFFLEPAPKKGLIADHLLGIQLGAEIEDRGWERPNTAEQPEGSVG